MALNRRSFVATAALAGAGGVPLAMPAIAQSAPEIRWRLTSSFPRMLDAVTGAATQLAKSVAEATDNKFQIQVFGAGEVVPGLQALDAVQSGSIDCAQTPLYFYFGKEPVFGFATGLPFGLNQRHQQAWWQFGGGEQIINGTLAKYNAISFPLGNSGTQMGGWFRKEINSVDDLKGLKFRIGGVGGAILSKLGTIAQQIAPSDIYPALERGTIDAAEFVGPHDDEKLGFVKVAKYYYYPGWWEGSAMMHLAVNIDKWRALPKAYQAILMQSCEAANTWMMARYDTTNAPALKRLVAAGAILKPFPVPVLEAAYKASHEVYADFSAKSPAFKTAFDSVNAYRDEQMPWWQIADYSFDTMMLSLRRG
jgi:TRAP-type mannitol/chloroaromatic compound transport system substrate-binding protein